VSSSASFRINTPHVVAETLDGEATIVDLDNGVYYALNESGTFIWDQLVAGAPVDAIAAALAEAYELNGDDPAKVVAELVEQLNGQKLIVPGAGPAGGAEAQPAANGSGRSYSRPQLNTYTDMQELLLLDPIHEVDESGWPNRP
jgi:outer membrane protein assembly factor BamB